ncbi:protein PHLOEM PROTEIN 2-LIKE A9-like [Rosa rugosa]|uniref:protein PHLOEM PROTEIN 2-LIKE A9-like n=1 Tax=Rosa rugosa TaxID=74645 RepID=UPI002B400C7B|nr:protein PHLOEM PROTEIN 2-LIKE A9-like [Rosa rugosa]
MAMTKPHWQAEKEENIKQVDNYLIKPRGLNIVWGNDERYWKIPARGTEDPAELVQVSWLEVTGSVELKAGKGYELTFDVGLAEDAFGWKDIQVFLMAKVGKKGKYKWTRVKLDQDQNNERVTIPDKQKLSIDVPADTMDTDLHFGLYEVWSGKWKGGLKIYNAKVTATA